MPSGSETAPTQLNPTRRRPGSAPRFALATLCLTEVVSWGVLFYAFPVASPAIVAQTGWSTTVVSGAFSIGLLTAAGAGIAVGRLLDRHGPHLVMTGGSVVATVAVLVVALAPHPATFVAGWVLAGVAQAAVLYPPAFAALTRWYGSARVRALTTLTLGAGLASTVFAPLTAALLEQLGWRHTYLVLGAALAVVTIPAHALGLRAPWPAAHTSARRISAAFMPIVRSRPFVMLAATVALTASVFGAATITLVPLLTAHGWPTSAAAWALGLTGLAQLVGRVGYAPLNRRTQPRTRTALVPVLAALPLAALASSASPTTVLAACAVLGITRGAFTLVESTAVADRWGTDQFGALYGILAAPAIVGVALSPWAAAAVASRLGGYPQLFGVLAAVTVLAASFALGTKTSAKSPAYRR